MAEEKNKSITFKLSTEPSEEMKKEEKISSPEPVISDRVEHTKIQNETVVDVKPPSTSSLADQWTKVSENLKKLDEKNPTEKKNKTKLILILGSFLLLGTGIYWFSNYGSAYLKDTFEYVSGKKKNEEVSIKQQSPLPIPEEKIETIEETKKNKPSKEETKSPEIIEVREYYIRIMNSDGTIVVKTGGSQSWRNDNPCSILYGNFSKENGAIGNDEKQSIFDSFKTGRKACYTLLFESAHGYKNLTVINALKRFAPSKEGFKTSKYIKEAEKFKIPINTTMKDLSEKDKNKVLDMIMKTEDYIVGKTITYENMEDFLKRGY